jgi:acyl-coenzyme A thioesterase PaaI-like protein
LSDEDLSQISREAGVMRQNWRHEHGGSPAYGVMIDTLRDFLNRVAAAKPDEATLAEMTQSFAAWSARLGPLAVPEAEQPFGFCMDQVGRGQTMSPPLAITHADPEAVTGEVTFGRYFLGGNGAVHGGAVALLLDEVLGRMGGQVGRVRTAYLHVDYRSITPIEARLDVKAWCDGEEGRKLILRAELRHGEVLCAEARGLYIKMRPGQP